MNKRIYFNEKTMCFEYPNGEVKETYEKKLDRELLSDKWRMRNLEGKTDVSKMIEELTNK